MWTKRIISIALALVMLLSAVPLTSFADFVNQDIPQGERPTVIQTADGDIPVEEDWDEAYPYGTFAFASYQADVGEPGAVNSDGEALPQTTLIPVYRLGGTHGQVTAWVTFAPTITTDASGEEQVFDYAASGRDDLLVEYENPSPIAAYQELGVPQWHRSMQPGELAVILADEGSPEEEGSLRVSLTDEIAADSFRWQASDNGVWKDVEGADERAAVLEVSWAALWDFASDNWTGNDLRCVYTLGGQSYCSVSLLGEVYEPIEAPEPIPADLDPEADPGYSVMEADEAYGLYEFPLTFADGETVKYIRITALDDETPELPELALFTITGCEGGELSATCNTMTLLVSDNDKGEASTLGFARKQVVHDRAEDVTVKVPVVREGGKSYNITVHYETVDGTAKAGVDYAAASGELAFAGSIDEIEIPIALIQNDATEDRSFTVQLTRSRAAAETSSAT